MNIPGWFPLGLTGLISLLFKRLSWHHTHFSQLLLQKAQDWKQHSKCNSSKVTTFFSFSCFVWHLCPYRSLFLMCLFWYSWFNSFNNYPSTFYYRRWGFSPDHHQSLPCSSLCQLNINVTIFNYINVQYWHCYDYLTIAFLEQLFAFPRNICLFVSLTCH